MMRSLFSGISGLRNHQTRMDVIGNNIANVNTVGYKSSRVIFQDIFSQNIAAGMANTGAAGAGAGGQGGTNPIQVGLGISLASIDVIHTRSAFQRTDRPTDMMINGEGFFIVRGPDGDFFTRAGNFSIDDEGFLVTAQGFFVMGYSVQTEMGVVENGRDEVPGWPNTTELDRWISLAAGDPTATPPEPVTLPGTNIPATAVIPTQTIRVPAQAGPPPVPAVMEDTIIPAGFFNTGDIIPAGAFRVNGQAWPQNDLTVRAGDPPMPSRAMQLHEPLPMRRNPGINSLVRPMQAVPPTFGLIPTGDVDTTTLQPIRVLRPDMPLIPTPLGMETLDQMRWAQVMDTGTPPMPIPGQYELDFDLMARYALGEDDADGNRIPIPPEDDLIIPGGLSPMEFFFANNFDTGDLQLPNFGVANNGDVTVLSGGRNVVIAQIAVGMFANPAGLEVAGNNLYRQTASSGEVIVGQAGFDGAGSISGGGLEMSNVDMADQFTDMIVTQRGFQANSRIITVTDSMLEELVNLKR